MKRYLIFLLVIMALIVTGCGKHTAADQEEGEKHMLVAYFSWSGNTRKVAEEIGRQTGADLYEIVPEDPYPEAAVEAGYETYGDNAGSCSEEIGEWLQNLGYVD